MEVLLIVGWFVFGIIGACMLISWDNGYDFSYLTINGILFVLVIPGFGIFLFLAALLVMWLESGCGTKALDIGKLFFWKNNKK